jgi:uncharacterized protein
VGHILTARRRPEILFASAAVVEDQPAITLPDGSTRTGTGPDVDAWLSEWLGEPVALVDAVTQHASTGEFYADATDDNSALIEWTMPPGRFVDAMPVLALTTSSLRAARSQHPGGDWSTRRFRANVVIESDGDEWLEDDWLHRTVEVGAAAITPRALCERCTMVTRPQPGGIERDLDTFRTLSRHHDGKFGVWSSVATTGVIRVGDDVRVV